MNNSLLSFLLQRGFTIFVLEYLRNQKSCSVKNYNSKTAAFTTYHLFSSSNKIFVFPPSHNLHNRVAPSAECNLAYFITSSANKKMHSLSKDVIPEAAGAISLRKQSINLPFNDLVTCFLIY